MVKDFKTNIEETELQHKHPFHFKELYKMMHDWMEEYGYASADGNDGYENYYTERIHDNGMKEIRFWWHVYKKPSPSGIVLYHMTIRIRALGIQDKEVVWGGKKAKVQDGELTVGLAQEYQIKYSQLNNHWLGNLLGEFIKKRWYKNYFEQYKKIGYNDYYHFENTLKRWLNWYQTSLVQRPHRDSLGGYRAESDL